MQLPYAERCRFCMIQPTTAITNKIEINRLWSFIEDERETILGSLHIMTGSPKTQVSSCTDGSLRASDVAELMSDRLSLSWDKGVGSEALTEASEWVDAGDSHTSE